MKINEIRKMSKEELVKKIKENKEVLFTKRMQAAQGSLEKPSKIRELKKDVARMKTIINERKNEEAGGDK